MTFKDLDSNFEEVAKNPIQTDARRKTDASEALDQEKPRYEDGVEKTIKHGLLALFEKKLINRIKQTEETSDEEFETIEITPDVVMPAPAGPPAEVSEEDIDKLLNKGADKYGDNFETLNTSVEQTISSVQRYDSVHQAPENTVTQTGSTDNPPITDRQGTQIAHQDATPYSQRGINEDEVARHIATHREQKNITKTKGNTETVINMEEPQDTSE